MRLRLICLLVACLCASSFFFLPEMVAQQAPPASAARILLLPRRVVSGERATLAVLDVSGRLTPGVTVRFSNGDELKTDTTGRSLFVAPLNPGLIFGWIAGRPGRVPMTVHTAAEVAATPMEVTLAPRVASIADRFELAGSGFCGDADANQVAIGGEQALVLASSPEALVILPPADLEPGRASVDVTCKKQMAPPLEIVFVALQLDDVSTSPLKPGEHRTLTVLVHGTTGKVGLEARNFAPEVADLKGGNRVNLASSGGRENLARFEVVGRKRGRFLISIRLQPSYVRPR